MNLSHLHKGVMGVCIAVIALCMLFTALVLAMPPLSAQQPVHPTPTATDSQTNPPSQETPVINPTPTPSPTPTSMPDKTVTVLLLGTDARNNESRSRTDTMVLVVYNQTKNTVKMVSLMRDTYVEIPGHGWNRLNAATALEGPELLMDTLEHNFGVSTDYYALVKFDGFQSIIDIIGGVDVELTRSEIRYINRKLHEEDKDWNNDIYAEPGIVRLNGAQALWHCRNRSSSQSDFDRTGRQRTVLKAMCQEAVDNMSIGMAIQLIPEAFKAVDTSMPLTTIVDLAVTVLNNGMPEIEDARLPFDGTFTGATKNGASVLEIDIDQNRRLLNAFLTGENTPAA